MAHNLINLLPPERMRAVRRGYFYRLGAVALGLLAAVIAIHAVLLLPSYLYLGAVEDAREKEAARLSAELAASEGGAASAELARIESDAAYLTRLATAPSASRAVRLALDTPRQGIRIRGITFAPPPGPEAAGKMTLIGNASTREALRAYASALGMVPGVAAVDLPISAYAKESDIDFSLTLTGRFMP